MQNEAIDGNTVTPPDSVLEPEWDLMSPTGIIATVQLAVGIFTKVGQTTPNKDCMRPKVVI